ncbi:hypothetical protein MLD38_011364 [Melastoma candidum]|uniref:Uncharacterized protein n=1 Tax=Melastoma candidum TaxID=119954 RepID=A0ACB9R2F7_9MYRT|nr:hypothetical protein MLD38_011364 [Melastoma candidum]
MAWRTERRQRRSKFLSSLIQRKKAVDQQRHYSGVKVRACNMPAALQDAAFRLSREILDSMRGRKLDSKRLALTLKKEFDCSYGPAWHCTVGTSFGSYIMHSLGGFLYFSIDKVYILLFRTAVEPLDH